MTCIVNHMSKILEVRDLSVKFHTINGTVNALNGVNFDIHRKEAIGFVGESGCGKSVTTRALMRILEKNSTMEGSIKFFDEGKTIDISSYKSDAEELRQLRGGKIAMIFQEPMSSLCPVYTVGNQIMEAIRLHSNATKQEAREQAIEYLAAVGISRPQKLVDDYPYQLSGGMRQRVMIAMALSCKPTLLIADEPTTALDVTVSAQILKLLEELREKNDMAMMMINHNMGIIAETCDRICVMYLGRIIETCTCEELFNNPQHPYTKDLLASIPKLSMKKGEKLAHIKGAVPDPLNVPKGCAYHNRCRYYKKGICDGAVPNQVEVAPGHFVACHMIGGDTVEQ